MAANIETVNCFSESLRDSTNKEIAANHTLSKRDNSSHVSSFSLIVWWWLMLMHYPVGVSSRFDGLFRNLNRNHKNVCHGWQLTYISVSSSKEFMFGKQCLLSQISTSFTSWLSSRNSFRGKTIVMLIFSGWPLVLETLEILEMSWDSILSRKCPGR